MSGQRRKVLVVVTARPSYSRIKTALRAIAAHPALELQLVVAASAVLDRYGNAQAVIERDGLPIAARVYNVLEGENLTSMAKTTGIGILELSTVFDNLRPDIVVTVADRFETMATAISAAYMNIPLVHVQGGEVTGNIDEKVRHSITKLADYHFVASEQARMRVLRMGEEPNSVFVTGCPSIDIASEVARNPEMDFDPINRYGGVGALVDMRMPYIVVLQHPVTTEYEEARTQIETTLHAVGEVGIQALWFWPNVDAGSDGTSKGIRGFRETHSDSRMRFFKNMEPADFLRVLCGSVGIVGNSSVAIRECAYLGVNAVNIGGRQRGRERGRNVIDVPHDKDAIKRALAQIASRGRPPRDLIYGGGGAGEQIAQLLADIPFRCKKEITY